MTAWLAVASADHVRRGRDGGFMQVGHGKLAPLRRIRPGDGIAYYSPSIVFGSKSPYRAFTALGIVAEREPYIADMGGGFQPARRDVLWEDTADAPIAPLLQRLSFSAGRKNWAQALRFGLLAVSAEDFAVIRAAMGLASTTPESPLRPPSRENHPACR
jgi:EVE domain